jgi:hypothetical protein
VSELSSCFERGDEVREFLVSVEEELDASQPWLVGLELEAPFHDLPWSFDA